jgi:mRNA-degrading endonuclease toxin of MazEF toxin-antitoxin module
MADPIRGEIWLADLGTGRGHEQSGQRPVLVVSDDAFNAGLAGLVMTVPLTSKVAKSKTALHNRLRIRLSPLRCGTVSCPRLDTQAAENRGGTL